MLAFLFAVITLHIVHIVINTTLYGLFDYALISILVDRFRPWRVTNLFCHCHCYRASAPMIARVELLLDIVKRRSRLERNHEC